MKLLQSILVAFSCLLCSFSVSAQRTADPTTWSYDVKKTGANEYELIFHVTLTEGWHVFSQNPGDEFLIPTSFVFDNTGFAKFEGKIEERGRLKTERMEGIDNPINYYERSVDFVQKVKAKPGAVITGQQEYQVCNDKMCLPPKKVKFSFTVKD